MSPFIIAISGSRTISDAEYVYNALDDTASSYLSDGYELYFHLGDAHGVDQLALQWCRERNFAHLICFADRKAWEFWSKARYMRENVDPDLENGVLAADWDADGLKAGPIRNHAMIAGCNNYPNAVIDERGVVQKADLLVAIWDGTSRGTQNARATARSAKVFCHTWIYPLVGASDLNESSVSA